MVPRPRRAGAPPWRESSLGTAHLSEDALEFRTRQRGQAEAAEPALILEEQGQAERVVRPADAPYARARYVGRKVEHVVGLAQADVHFASVGQPPRPSRFPKPLVGELHAPEVRLERLVLRCDRHGIGGLVKLPPDGGPLVWRSLAQLVHPVLAIEVAQQADHLIVVGDRPLLGEAHQEPRGASRGGALPERLNLEAPFTHRQGPWSQRDQRGGEVVASRKR